MIGRVRVLDLLGPLIAIAGVSLGVFNFLHARQMEEQAQASERENLTIQFVSATNGPHSKLRDVLEKIRQPSRIRKHYMISGGISGPRYDYDGIVYKFFISNISHAPATIVDSAIGYSMSPRGHKPRTSLIWTKYPTPQLPINIPPMSTATITVEVDIGLDISNSTFLDCSREFALTAKVLCIEIASNDERKIIDDFHYPVTGFIPTSLQLETATHHLFTGEIPYKRILPVK